MRMDFLKIDARILTERLEIRPQTLADAQALFESLASDERVTKYMDWKPVQQFDPIGSAERYAKLADDMASGKRIGWVVRKLDESKICGKVELRIHGQDGDMGYILAPSHWGQGIMPEAVAAVLRFARRLGLRRITGTCDPDNRASIRVFEKCGFRYTGRQRAALLRPALSDELRDSECYEIGLQATAVLRPATPSDRPFVEGIYFDTQRWLIERLFGWRGDDVERAKFNDFYDEKHTQIVQVEGEDVGWLTVLRESDSIEVDSIYISSARHGAGLGTSLLEQIIAEADAEGKPVTISTAKINPARRLYNRLGFEVTGESEFKVYMERKPRGLTRTPRSTEPVVLAPYDTRWPSIFAREVQHLQPALQTFGLRRFEHVGSTAIPGMSAKPIVDIMAGADKMDRIPTPEDPIWASLGYEWGHGSDQPEDWLYFIKRDSAGKRIAHLHVVPYEGEFWMRVVAFRDALREDPNLAREYEALKTRLATEYGDDRLRYRDEKAAFVQSIAERRLSRQRSR